MTFRRKAVLIGASSLALAGGGAAASGAFAGNDGESSVAPAQRARVAAAALKLVPGGTVRAVERDTEHGAMWEAEVVNADGSSVDVRLDEQLRKVDIEPDRSAPADDD